MKVARQVMPVLAELNARRDLVFIDQRGTGQSNPLECDVDEGRAGIDARTRAADRAPRPVPEGAYRRICANTQPGSRCVTSKRYAAQLGAERINLWGASYGTRAALEYMRQYPDRVRTAVLDGVAPPDMALPVSFALDADAALKSLSDACARR